MHSFQSVVSSGKEARQKKHSLLTTQQFDCNQITAAVYSNRGNVKNGLGCSDDAFADYDTAIRLNPHFAEAYYNRGVQKVLCEELDAAIADYDKAIRLKSDSAEAYANLGMTKAGLDRIDEAKSDLQTALELAERQGNDNLTAFIEERLQQLDLIASKQDNKESRRGGQWKGKVKITEDFDEISESFMEVFRGDNE